MDDLVARYGTDTEAAIPILQAIQSHYRYLPDEALRRVAERTEITPAQIAGTSSFYAQYRRSPVGRHVVRICHGTACHVKGAGALYQVTMEAKGLRKSNHWKDLSFMESCVRAYVNDGRDMIYLSSGLEDYFLGTYYFKKGTYANKLAGLTHLDKEENEFSAYRLHEDDPVFFQNGLRLTNRCGEKIGDKVFHDPPKTRYTTYVWLYQW